MCFYFLIYYSRQSKAISFFPTEDSTNHIEALPNRNNDDDQLKFTNGQRHENFFLNQDEQMVNPKQQQNYVPQQNYQQPQYYASQKPQQSYANPQENYQLGRPQYQFQPQQQQQPQNPNQFIGNYQNYYNRPQRPAVPPQPPYYQQNGPLVRPNYPSGAPNSPFYNQNYANQYDYNRPGADGNPVPNQSTNPIANFFNNLQQGQLGGAGGQFSKALDDISRFDDYQCVPKLLCQMIGNQRRQGANRPGFLNGQTLTA